MTRRRSLLVAIGSLVLSACLAGAAPPQEPSFDPLRQVEVEVSGNGARHRFQAWVAETPGARARGLMHVRKLPERRGMLFLFESPQFASFWMKDTYIPLDLLFVAPDGGIVDIVAEATPLSLEPLESTAPVKAVLELAGGTARRLGIRPGDRLRVLEDPASVTR